ncbi:LiaF domain-containing protein [Chloroflexota bacterium]
MKNVAILGGSKIGLSPWKPGKKVWSIAVFGGSEIDFRQAELEEGITEVVAFSLFGGTDIIVPQNVPVTLSGLSILGGKELKRSEATEVPPKSTSELHINAISIFGGCEVTDQAKDK